MIKFYDTCSLLLKVDSLFDAPFAISSITIEELENIKTSSNKDADVKFAARKIIQALDQNYGQYGVVIYQDSFLALFNKEVSASNDMKILACALHLSRASKDLIFVTNDLCLKHLARVYFPGPVESIPEDVDDYDGYKDVLMTEEEMSKVYSEPKENTYDLLENQYLIMRNAETNEIVDKMCWTEDGYRGLNFHSFNSKWFGEVKPMKGDVYQALAADSLTHNKITLVKGPAGSGKAQPKSLMIPTPSGLKRFGDLTVGDYVFDHMGEPTKITGVFPKGVIDNYKVYFEDGRFSYCNSDHLWDVYLDKWLPLETVPLSAIIRRSIRGEAAIPFTGPVQYPEKEVSLDPYVAGAFIAGGNLNFDSGEITLNCFDEEVVALCAEKLKTTDYSSNPFTKNNWIFKNVEIFSQIVDAKTIPDVYLYNSPSNRMALLRGMLDVGGDIDVNGFIRFSTTDKDFASQVQDLCWGLGFYARLFPLKNSYALKINCSKEVKHTLFSSIFKKSMLEKLGPEGIDRLKILQIKDIESDDMQCIQVENPKGLYLTNNYLVTHNTYLSLGYLVSCLEKGKIDKIIVFCNTVATANSAKLGYYPGTRDEKLLDSQIGNLLISKFGGRTAVEQMIQHEKLVLLPLSDIRGYDTTGMRAGIYISEAQNLDISLMKLTLQRIGEDSICIVDGDCKAQVDDIHFAGANNGMRRLSKVYRGEDVYGEVTLKEIHRSKIAKIAEKM